MKIHPMHYYLYKGKWIDLYYELVEMLMPSEEQIFAVWEPKDIMKEDCLVIVYGMPLADSYCYQKSIWKLDENIFNSFYLPHIKEFRIYNHKKIVDMPLTVNDNT